MRIEAGASLLFLLTAGTPPSSPSSPAPATSPLEFTSSDPRLTQGFRWAKQQALAYVMDGDPVGPWYEAALPGREAFCMRDVSHQAMGAHALGLAPYTRNMLRRFAENVADSRDWASYWEIDRYNRPAPVDYKNDEEFWYNLPANFDVLDAAYRMYLWTGDRAYVEDPVFLNYYDRTVTDYVARWDLGLDRVMTRARYMNLHGATGREAKFRQNRGIPSYIENGEDFILGADLLATMYAGFRSYAQLQDVRGDHARAAAWLARADSVKALLNRQWWNEGARTFHSLLAANGTFSGDAAQAVLYRGAADDGRRAQGALDALLATNRPAGGAKDTRGIEEQAHDAETFYRYGAADAAYARLIDLTRPGRSRQEYPEVSYSVVGAIVTGTMGITMEASSSRLASEEGSYVDRVVRTRPALGTIAWAELRHLPIRRNDVAVRHEGIRRTRFTNLSGPALVWHASLPGAHTQLLVNGRTVEARPERDAVGHVYSAVRVAVGAGNTVVVEVGPRGS